LAAFFEGISGSVAWSGEFPQTAPERTPKTHSWHFDSNLTVEISHFFPAFLAIIFFVQDLFQLKTKTA
jgi:hypothetical protein